MSEIPQHVMKAAADAHAEFAKSSVRDNLTTIIARAIAKAVEEERLRFEGDLDKWMKIIGAGITGFQPEAYAVMDTACEELVRLRTALSEAEQRVPEGWGLVPLVSTGEMEDAARHLMMWLDFDRPTEAALLAHCKRLGKEPPPECRDVDHVPPKATRLFWVYRAMCAAVPALIPSEPHDAEGSPSWQDPSIFDDTEGRN